MTDLAQVRERYRADKTALFKSLAASGSSTRGIRQVLQKLTRHTDATLQLLWEIAGFPPDACLVAAGGFGRGELYPIPTWTWCCCCRTTPGPRVTPH